MKRCLLLFVTVAVVFLSTGSVTSAATTGTADTFLLKYDTLGNIVSGWDPSTNSQLRYDSTVTTPIHDVATGVGTTASPANIYVAGTQLLKYDTAGNRQVFGGIVSPATALHQGIPSSTVAVSASGDYFVIVPSNGRSVARYTSAGTQLWQSTLVDNCSSSSSFPVRAYAIALDSSAENVYVAGYDDNNTGCSSTGVMVAKFNATTGALQWRVQNPSSGSSGDVGYANGVIVDPTNAFIYIASFHNGIFRTLKLNTSNGSQVWVRNVTPGTGYVAGARSVVTDALGNVYVGGQWQTFGLSTMVYRVIKYDAAGIQLWSVTAPSDPLVVEYMAAMAIDPTGTALYATGQQRLNGQHAWTVKYNTTDGSSPWQRVFDFGNQEWGRAITVDDTGVYVAGDFYASPPDLRVSNLAISPTTVYTGNVMTFSGLVRNWGETVAAASQTRLRIDIDNNGSWDITPADQSTGSLGYFATETETWTNIWTAVAGTHRYEICADATNVVVEQNESNNCATANFTVTNPSAPSLALPTKSTITTTSATLGATVTSDGGAALSARGTCWGSVTNPTTNCLAEGGTAVSAYTHSRTGFSANTSYYYRGYAVNAGGTGYSTDDTFLTLPAAPTIGTAVPASTSITVNWTLPGGTGSLTSEVGRCSGSNCTSFSPVQSGVIGSSYGDSGLTPGGIYRYRVRSTNTTGYGAYSAATANVQTLPAQPGSPTFANINTTTLTVNWESATGAAGYNLYRCAGASCDPTATAPIVLGNVQTYGDSGLTANTTYRYAVAARNSGGALGAPSPTSQTATLPTAPTGMNLTNIQSTSITVNWTAPGGSVPLTYKIERCQGAGCSSFTEIASGVSGVSYVNNTGLVEGTSYSYRVRATNSTGNGAYSNTATGVTLTGVPGTPTFSNVLTTTLTTNWISAAGAASYNLYRCAGASCDPTVVAPIVLENVLTYNNTSLTANTVYRFAVRALNSAGVLGSFSGVGQTTTLSNSPDAPNVDSATASSLTVTWSAPSGGASTYRVERCAGVGCNSGFTTVVSGTASTTFIDSGLSSGTTYGYRVYASNAVPVENSSPSGIGYGATESADNPPTAIIDEPLPPTIVVDRPYPIDASGSNPNDPGQTIILYTWVVEKRVGITWEPAIIGSDVLFEDDTTATPTFTALLPGIYRVGLTVTDDGPPPNNTSAQIFTPLGGWTRTLPTWREVPPS